MKSIKKWIAAAAAVCMAVGFTACGQEDAPEAQRDESTRQTEPAQEICYALASEIVYFDGEAIPTRTYSYDTDGRLIKTTLDMDVDQQWSEEDELYYVISYPDGKLDMIDSFEYNCDGMVSRRIRELPEAETEELREQIVDYVYTYDSSGAVFDCVGYYGDRELDYRYEFSWLNGKLVGERIYDSFGDSMDCNTILYEYDDAGLLSEVRYEGPEDVLMKLSYDENQRLTKFQMQDLWTQEWMTVEAQYDQNGNPLPLEDHGYTLYYDKHGNLEKVEEDGELIISYTYQPFEHNSSVLWDGRDIAYIRQMKYLYQRIVPGFTYVQKAYDLD